MHTHARGLFALIGSRMLNAATTLHMSHRLTTKLQETRFMSARKHHSTGTETMLIRSRGTQLDTTTNQPDVRPARAVHVRALRMRRAGRCARHHEPEPLPHLSMESPCGYAHRRPTFRLPRRHGAHRPVGALRWRMGHRPPLHALPIRTHESHRRRRFGTDPALAGHASAGPAGVSAGPPGPVLRSERGRGQA